MTPRLCIFLLNVNHRPDALQAAGTALEIGLS